MQQIKLAETLFEKLLNFLEYFKIKEQSPTSFVISFYDNKPLVCKNLVDELEISIYKTRLKRMYNMSAEILNQWNKEIYYLKSDGQMPCFHVNSDYSVGEKTSGAEYSVWSELYPTARMYSFDALINYVNGFNGYCLKEFIQPSKINDLETPPQVETVNNEVVSLKDESFFENTYKKHPKGLELSVYPNELLTRYQVDCEYLYLDIEGFGDIPIQKVALKGVELKNIKIEKLPLKEYAKGFIEGYNIDLIPFIDNNDTRVELVLKEGVFKGLKGFCEHGFVVNEEMYQSDTMFESGVFEGKRYKAWEIILQTPSVFIKYFQDNIKDEDVTPLTKKEKNYKALYHVLSYFFDCDVKGEFIPMGQKTKLESIGNKRIGKGKGNRFYQEVKTVNGINRNIENELIGVIGEDWREAVLQLSDNPKALDEYLKSKLL